MNKLEDLRKYQNKHQANIHMELEKSIESQNKLQSLIDEYQCQSNASQLVQKAQSIAVLNTETESKPRVLRPKGKRTPPWSIKSDDYVKSERIFSWNFIEKITNH